MSEDPRCPDCDAAVGQPHRDGCDVELCTVCSGQRLSCACAGHDPVAASWMGEWPGVAECRMRGWWAVMVPGKGWQPCEPGTPGCIEDLNRLSVFQQTGQDLMYAQPSG